jgi:hypothetical protein
MTFTYCYLDLPPLPQSIIDQAYLSLEKKEKIGFYNTSLHELPGHKEYRNRVVKFKDGTDIESVESYRYWISDEFDDWVKTHAQQDPRGCGINIFSGGALVAPHVDASRFYNIQYILETGGDNVETVWYREKGKDVLRPDLKGNFNLKDTIDDYSRVEEIDRVQFPVGKWVCLNVGILHAVENMQGPRVAIHLSRQTAPDHLKYTFISKIQNDQIYGL